MATPEPPKPQRGQTAEERGRDVPAAQAQLESEDLSFGRHALRMLGPRFYFGQADGYPTAIKWFLWFCMVLIWPAWIVAILLGIVVGYVGFGILWVLFSPLRMWQKRNNPEEYAATKEKFAKKSA